MRVRLLVLVVCCMVGFIPSRASAFWMWGGEGGCCSADVVYHDSLAECRGERERATESASSLQRSIDAGRYSKNFDAFMHGCIGVMVGLFIGVSAKRSW